MILLICASWVARITGMSHQHLAQSEFLFKSVPRWDNGSMYPNCLAQWRIMCHLTEWTNFFTVGTFQCTYTGLDGIGQSLTLATWCSQEREDSQVLWLMPVILATQETEIRRVAIQSQPPPENS
jgi:hypothetical protein